jgi:septal ring factor EnvC (AmiA/AmiB activator)
VTNLPVNTPADLINVLDSLSTMASPARWKQVRAPLKALLEKQEAKIQTLTVERDEAVKGLLEVRKRVAALEVKIKDLETQDTPRGEFDE